MLGTESQTQVFRFYDPPEDVGATVEFRLIYRGSLPSQGSGGGSRLREKHLIRKEFHKQLRELWKQHPDLRVQSEQRFVIHNAAQGGRQIFPAFGQMKNAKTWVEHIADSWQRCGGRFVPLISKQGGFTCSLNILFLRRDNPGNLIASGGDIDNRLKVLFDGLKMPSTVDDLADFAIDADENPFYCLLEDDSLITDVSVTTDRLLLAQDSGEKLHDVVLVIHVTMLNPSAVFAGNRLI